MKLTSLIESGDPELLATGFQFTEGPVWMPDGYLLFSDIPASRIYKWHPAGKAVLTDEDDHRVTSGTLKIWRQPTNNSNGLTLDREGRLLACEHSGRRVSITTANGAVETLVDTYLGKQLNSPNDIVVKSDGAIYFTDPPYGIEPQEKEQPHNGVYRVAPDGTIGLLVDDFVRPNGLAFSPDESSLYIDDSGRRHVRAFDVQPDGSIANSRVIADMDHPQPGSPDGMKVDVEGHLYVTGATGIWVFEPDGTCLGVIVPGERPANCAWGDADRQSLYITARTSLYRIRVKVPGLPIATTV